MNAISRWHSLKSTYLSPFKQDSTYQKLYPYLKEDGKFLTDYGTFILENRQNLRSTDLNKAISFLETAKKMFISKNMMEALGYGYWMKKDYEKAICCFEWIDNFVPYLFEPKLALMNINLQLGNFRKSKEIGILIIKTPPKIPSDEVNKIKEEAKYLIKKYDLYKF